MRRLAIRSQVICSAVMIGCFASCGGGGGGGGSSGAVDPAQSSVRTQQSAGELLRGSDDFDTMAANLRQAVALDPSNSAARLFLGFAEFLDSADRLALEPTGRVRSVGSRSGFVDTSVASGLWNFRAQRQVQPSEGQYPASMPRLPELAATLEQDVLPMLTGLVSTLQSIPGDFRWMISASDISQHPAGQGTTPSRPVYEFDFGDVRLLSAGLRVCVATVDLALAYSGTDLDFNDFDEVDNPSADVLRVIRDAYPGLGNVARPAMVAACRDQLEAAFADYQAAASHLRGEDALQQAVGVFSLSPDRLSTTRPREEVLGLEQSWREWVGGFVSRFRTNQAYLVTSGPEGQTWSPQEQFSINLFRFFQGINFRDLYFRTVEDPRTGRFRFGVTSLSQVDAAMLTIGGALASIGGSSPRVGTAQSRGLVFLRVDNPPLSVKSIDGSFSDWNTGSIKIADETTLSTNTGALNLGNVFASVGANQLFLRLDRNYLDLVNRPSGNGYAQVQVEYYDPTQWPTSDRVSFWSGSTQPSAPWNGSVANNEAGMEASFSIPGGFGPLWAVVSISVDLYESFGLSQVSNTRDQIFIRLR